MIPQRFAGIDGLRAVLQRCPGELSITAAWREGQGFGVTVAAQAGTPDDAAAAAADLDSILEKRPTQVAEQDGLYTLPATKGGRALFSTLVCWTTRQQWLLAASHPDWVVQSSAKPTLALPGIANNTNPAALGNFSFVPQSAAPPSAALGNFSFVPTAAAPPSALPAIANNANLAAFGNFSFVPSLAKAMGGNDALLAMIAPMLGQWSLTMKIDDDGGAVRSRISGGSPLHDGNNGGNALPR